MKNILDRFENEAHLDRTMIFKALLDQIAKEDEEEQSFERMTELAEQLLEYVLNSQENNTEDEE